MRGTRFRGVGGGGGGEMRVAQPWLKLRRFSRSQSEQPGGSAMLHTKEVAVNGGVQALSVHGIPLSVGADGRRGWLPEGGTAAHKCAAVMQDGLVMVTLWMWQNCDWLIVWTTAPSRGIFADLTLESYLGEGSIG